MAATNPAMDSDTRNIREAILAAGLAEFSRQGFDGARLDRIAAAAGCAKRMVYYYFESKEGLYLAVLEKSYSDIRRSETGLDLSGLPPAEALVRLAVGSFDYHQRNLDFTRLVLVENLQGGRLVGTMREGGPLREAALRPLTEILARGVADGTFRDGIDPVDLHYLISALSAFRMDHARTWHGLLEVDLMADEVHDRHRGMIGDVVLDFARKR